MSRTLDRLKASLGTSIRAGGSGVSMAVAVTDAELITASPKLFGAPTLAHYPLTELTGLELVPNPSAYRLQIRFGDRHVMLLYHPENAADFDAIIALLKSQLSRDGK